MNYVCGSFFTGVGGIDLGFEQAGFKTVYANEFDPYPIKTFEENFNIKVDGRSVTEVHGNEIPNFDVIFISAPCQAFSIAGYRQGFDDEKGRGTLFFETIRIIREKKAMGHQPKVVFFENVKNLVGHDNGNTFKVMKELLEHEGYHIKYKVLNSCEFGNVPQNRERIYIVGFLDEDVFDRFEFPSEIELTNSIENVIDFEASVDEKYYYREGKYKGDIFEQLEEAMKDDCDGNRSVYQWRRKYVRRNKSGVIPCLCNNFGKGGHNVPLIKTKSGEIRKMLPRECFNAQGFPKDFKLPNLADSRLYQQAGNSVTVPVIYRIACSIRKAINE